ncbi:UDP-N-acetylmuramate dehydrogenase [Nocardioides sp. zg-579]|uniref:UDP-N-acetylenolpyruvoylglucosamine reductase n=1 Tax=Nocardioides marmotae TaxID=2663857 RepID=A0A6I3IXI0_9ACTN|nr:UDP-N-acetylmuramate dehydrogenase [Nocardioides marmotae]MCR6030166.1 UDP-N-acetylmuramate dehydrogenase [Gordonia jinghuaiqii]MTB93797.1 UDP-N-acetylmuramate dehydrogenase [Nocardioides marmotae]QKE00131.1 UDP-N-acetylmuramate dehydrogenase [Nocardioides marmotae]
MPEPAPSPASSPGAALLRDHTTLRLGGPAGELVVATTEAEVLAALDTDRPVLVLGGGSNLVVADEGFPGRVVKVATTGITADVEGDDPSCGGVLVTVAAGEPWDRLVEVAVDRGWVGVEALSGIPGSVGATPIQNVGAYGQEVAQTIASVRVWDRALRGVRTFANAECGFSYRHSRFKADPGRHVVLSVTFQLRQGTLGAPVQYAELARTLGVEPGQRAPLREVREAVLGLRRGKGMVLDDADHDTWSAGSFFTNPVVPADQVPEDAPAWPAGDGLVKTSAAWLIDHAGFGKGYAAGRVSLSTKHALALTNRGGATTAELLGLAREVRDGVQAAYGIRLVNEPVLVGCEL